MTAVYQIIDLGRKLYYIKHIIQYALHYTNTYTTLTQCDGQLCPQVSRWGYNQQSDHRISHSHSNTTLFIFICCSTTFRLLSGKILY